LTDGKIVPPKGRGGMEKIFLEFCGLEATNCDLDVERGLLTKD